MDQWVHCLRGRLAQLVVDRDMIAVCQVFPKRDITNVVESSEEVNIGSWCGFGHSSCHHEFSVRPFRCLGICCCAF